MKVFVVAPLVAVVFASSLLVAAPALPPPRWVLADDGGIAWTPVRGERHNDHVEMSGLRVSTIVSYGFNAAGRFTLSRQVIWPLLRFAPNETTDHFALTFGDEAAPKIYLDLESNVEYAAPFTVARIHQLGLLRMEGVYGRNREVGFIRTVFPSVDQPLVLDRTVLTNRSTRVVVVHIENNARQIETHATRGVNGAYVATATILGAGERTLKPGESAEFSLVLSARKISEPSLTAIDPAAEERARRDRFAPLLAELQLVTPDPVLNTAFAFAKIRATESIYATKAGLMHSPGGGAYYAAIWANDQAEYAGPFFAMLADPTAQEAALNCYRLFSRYLNPDYRRLPSSIISEGAGTWNGQKDRGDMAMLAYGASRYALTRGDRAVAKELWPLITWCLEYCRRQLTSEGVVASDTDELENRFPSGKANLCTSALYYDALLSAANLARELGEPAATAVDFTARAAATRAAVENYFGATVAGFVTYRYFDRTFPSYQARHTHYANEPDHLRAWICVPLTMGIYDRAAATIDALFSPQLWTADGLATEAGQNTFWDRSTLYALRGVFAAGQTQRALDYLTYYSNRRLLGDHVPYAVEAFPEGNQRHLSAESALYCRIFTEGVFGLRPTALRAFDLTPRLPAAWPSMALKNVHAFATTFDLTVTREAGRLRVELTRAGHSSITHLIADGETTHFDLP